MALVYRAHFVFIRNPIMTSKGFNTSAIYGFTNTLLQILNKEQPTHLAVAFDTMAPTQRHAEYPEYKAQREEMPEDLSQAIPHIYRIIEAFNIPIITCDGYEADDIIGTLAKRVENEGFQTYMVTPDKDFAQLVSTNTFLYKPARLGDEAEILGVPEVLETWGVEKVEQVIDILGLWGDTVDNIPGVPGIGEKTAKSLIAQFDSLENLIANSDKLKGKQKQNVETYAQQALLSKRLATILCDAPLSVDLESLKRREPDQERLKNLFIEFEFNRLGKRVFGESFTIDRSRASSPALTETDKTVEEVEADIEEAPPAESEPEEAVITPIRTTPLKTISDVSHDYRLVNTAEERAELISQLKKQKAFCFDSETTGLNPKTAELVGLAFSFQAHTGCYVPFPAEKSESQSRLEEFRGVFEDENLEKIGHNLKFDLSILKWQGISVKGKLFDTMLAHYLVEPQMRHSLDFLSETYLDYSPIPIRTLIGDKETGQISIREVPVEKVAEYAAEDADVAWQLREILQPRLKEKNAERIFYEVECPLIPVLVSMEYDGVALDSEALKEYSAQIALEIQNLEQKIYESAGLKFHIDSPKQLGEVLFDKLKLDPDPKKTRTGQYATDAQILNRLAAQHEIVRQVLDFRAYRKLQSTYVDMLPSSVFSGTGRIHTTYNQAVTATGRMQSYGPNLQNIPIKTEKGKEIRKAFIPRGEEYLLLSADYSQIELRIIAELSQDEAMLEAFIKGLDIHQATAAKVYGVELDEVTENMRRQAKMINYGIIYGISAFGLAQRMGISRHEAAAIIEQYFKQYPSIKDYINRTIEFAHKNGYVETLMGRRRYLRDINSRNATTRGSEERNAINAPIQGTAADMIKIAMSNIYKELVERELKTKMILQVHDELVFDLYKEEKDEVIPIVEQKMKAAIPMRVPIVVEVGIGTNWLEAH
jgi:DNA polymerase-1